MGGGRTETLAQRQAETEIETGRQAGRQAGRPPPASASTAAAAAGEAAGGSSRDAHTPLTSHSLANYLRSAAQRDKLATCVS